MRVDRRRRRDSSASSTRSDAKSCAVKNTSSCLASTQAARSRFAVLGRSRKVRGASGSRQT